jgi:hypothetical protein
VAGNNEFVLGLDLTNLTALEKKLDQGLKLSVVADIAAAQKEIQKLQASLSGISSKTLVKLPTQQRLDAFVSAMNLVKGLGNLNLNLDVKLPTEARLNAFVKAMQDVQHINLSNVTQTIQPLSQALQTSAQAAVTLVTSMRALQNLAFGPTPAGGSGGGGTLSTPPGRFQEARVPYDSVRYGGSTFRTTTQINREDRAFEDAQREIERRLGEVNASRIFGGNAQGTLDSIKKDAARKFDFPVSAFQQQLSDVKTFNPKNVFSREGVKNIGAAGLISGNLFGAAGATIATGAFGPEAAFVGGQIGENVGKVFEGITRAMEGTIEKGVEYQRSVNAIAAVLSQTTVSVKGGKVLTGTDALLDNFAQAREIQNLARRQLLPLGVSGESEAALVSGTVSALGSRGISATAKQFANISGNIGSGVAALAPDLISNPTILRRDVEDIITGSPRATQTALGIRLKGFAPELFGGNLRSADDFERATEKLRKLSDVITSSGDGAAQLTRSFSLMNNAFTVFGDGLLKGLSPTLEKLNSLLGNQNLTETIEQIGEGFGKLISFLIDIGANVISFSSSMNNFGATLSGAFPPLKAIIDLLSRFLPSGVGTGGGKDTGGRTSFSSPSNNAKTIVDRFGLGDDISKVTEQQLKDEEGSPGLKRRGLDLLLGGELLFPNALKGAVGDKRSLLLGSRVKSLKEEISKGKEDFDLQTLEGQQAYSQFAQPLLNRRTTELSEIVGDRRSAVDRAKSALDAAQSEANKPGANPVESENKIFAATRDLDKVTQLLIDSERDLGNARRDSLKNSLGLADFEANKSERARKAKGAFTIGEQRADLTGEVSEIDQRINNRRRALLGADNTQAGDLQDQLIALESQKRAVFRKAPNLDITEDKLRFGLVNTQNDRVVVDLKARQSLEQFADSVLKADRALTDFSENTRLRSLGQKGEIIAAAKNYVRAGGSETSLPVDVQQLLGQEEDITKGIAFEQLKDVRRKYSFSRTFDDELNTKKALGTGLDLLRAEQEGAPVKNALAGIDLEQLRVSQEQLLGNDAKYDRSFLPDLNSVKVPFDSEIGQKGADKLNQTHELLDAVRQHLKDISKNTVKNTGGDFDRLSKNDIADAMMTGIVVGLRAEFA